MKAVFLLAVLFQATVWSFTLTDTDGNTVLDSNSVKIVFQGARMAPGGGQGTGSLTLNGNGKHGIGPGDGPFTARCADGVCTMSFAGRPFKLIDFGKKLTYGDQSFDLTEGKKTIIIKATGPAEVESPN